MKFFFVNNVTDTFSKSLCTAGSADFLGLQLYTSNLVTAYVNPLSPSSYYNDRDLLVSHDPSWKR